MAERSESKGGDVLGQAVPTVADQLDGASVLSVDPPRPRGEHLTSGPLMSTVFFLALPALGEQILTALVGFVDTWLAGRIDTQAQAAVGLASYVGWLVAMVIQLVGTGTLAIVARRVGAGERWEANAVANQAVLAGGALGLIIFPLVFMAAPAFARLQNMSGPTREVVVEYLRYDSLGFVMLGCTLAGAAALRGSGDMKTPLLILGAINVINMMASPALTFGWGPMPEMGVRGIVVGTVVARFLGGFITLGVLLKGRSGIRLHGKLLRPDKALLAPILRIGLPAMGNGLIMWSGQFMFLMIITRLASGATQLAYYAAHMISIRLEALTYLPAVAWGTASATLVGQALGAGEIARARRVAHVAVMQCGLIGLGVAVWFFTSSESILRFMQRDSLVVELGGMPFRWLGIFQPLLVAAIVYVNSLQGAGDTRTPLIYSLVGVLVIRVPLAYLCGIVLDGGLIGAWVGMFGDMTARSVFGFVRYTWGRWHAIRL